LGAITAVGGGVVRDVLLAQIPVVLRVDIYAAAVLRRHRIGVPRTTAAIWVARSVSRCACSQSGQNWQLPKAGAF
jgi:uncharacterized membrane protein YeiH